MENRNVHIIYYFIVIFTIGIFSSCEKEINGDVFISPSKIWINSIVKSDENIKIFLGTTSGMNSGDISRYRDDAKIIFFINNSNVPFELKYTIINEGFGYYGYPRLAKIKPGDSLRFEGWIEGADMPKVEGKTIIPFPAKIDSIAMDSNFDYVSENTKVDISISIDTTGINDNKYFILHLQNQEYSYDSAEPEEPIGIDDISIKNNLEISYGMYWNEMLHSILVDYEKLEDNKLQVTFYVDKRSAKNKLVVTLKTITEDYFSYSKALDNNGVIKSNIVNGTGIFTGYSEDTKSIIIN